MKGVGGLSEFILIHMTAVDDVTAVSEGFCPRCLIPLKESSICPTCATFWEIYRLGVNPYTGCEVPPLARGIQPARGATIHGR